jgi:radical SAM superfamily enzyme YgiQ (UPF0313 family)
LLVTLTGLLVNPPTISDVEGIGINHTPYFELQQQLAGRESARTIPGEHPGLGLIAATARDSGLDVRIINGQTRWHGSLQETLQDIRDASAKTDVFLVGFSGPVQVFEENRWLARQVRSLFPDALTVLGHDFASLNWPQILQRFPEFDAVVIGDGELVYRDLLIRLENGQDWTTVRGVAHRARGDIAMNPVGAASVLDDLPWVARDDAPRVRDAGFALGVFAHRGCPYSCTYCSTGTVSGPAGISPVRQRGVEPVVAEIEYVARTFDVDHVTITDDLFVNKSKPSQQWAIDFANALRTRVPDITYMIDCRIDSIVEETFRELATAGLRRVFIGIETADTDQQSFYDKTYRTRLPQSEYIRKQLSILEELGIEVLPGIIAYHPHVNRDELWALLDMIKTIGATNSDQLLKEIIAYPGTPLHHAYERDGLLTGEWPHMTWNYKDPRAREHARTMHDAANRGLGFSQLEQIFSRLLDDWNTLDATMSPGSQPD